MSNELLTGLSVILAAISIIVSVVGWSVTFQRQKEILEKQIAAELYKEKTLVYVSTALDELEKIKSWVNRGNELDHAAIKTSDDKDNIIEQEIKWVGEYNEISHLAYYLEDHSNVAKRHKNDDLEQYIFDLYHVVTIEFKENILGEILSDFELWRKANTNVDAGYCALDRIDVLRQKILGQPIPNHYLKYKK